MSYGISILQGTLGFFRRVIFFKLAAESLDFSRGNIKLYYV